MLEPREVPATFDVTSLADGGTGSGSLRSAIISANTSFQNQTNTINLRNGTYSLALGGTFEDAGATGDLDITGNQTLIIQGNGAGVTVIDAELIDRVFHVIGSGVSVTFKDLTITGGYLESTPEHLTLHGGGILNEGGNVTLSGVTITGNELTGFTDTAGGGVYSGGGRLTITNSTISANKLGYIEQYSGNLNGAHGARGRDGHPIGFDGTSGQNAPAGGNVSGGGVYVRNTTAVVSWSTITANVIRAGDGVTGGSGGNGGHGQDNAVSTGYPNLIPGDMGGSAGNGGAGGSGGTGIAVDSGTLTISDTQITSNSATGGAGGAGGAGGEGGAYIGRSGAGGAAGSGGAARGAVYLTRVTSPVVTPGAVNGRYVVWVRFRDVGGRNVGWAATSLVVRPVLSIGTLTVAGPGGAVTGNGRTDDTFTVTGARPGAVLSVAASLGTVVGDARHELAGHQVIVGANGAAVIRVRRPLRGGTGTVAVTEVTGAATGTTTVTYSAPRTLQLDMTAAGLAPTLPDPSWIGVAPSELYSATQGYGWLSPVSGGDAYRNVPHSMTTDRNGLYRDFHTGTAQATFAVYVGVGQAARVTVSSYAGGASGPVVALTGGARGAVRPGATTVTLVGRAGADGIIRITMAGVSGWPWVVSGLRVDLVP